MSENLLVNYYNVIPFDNSSELLDIFEKAQEHKINENEFNLKYLTFIKNIKSISIYAQEYEEDYINKITGLFYCQAIYSNFIELPRPKGQRIPASLTYCLNN